MNQNAIIVDYNPFTNESNIFICSDGERETGYIGSEINDLASEVIGLSYQYDIYDVKVHGPFAISSEIRKEINKREKDTYSQNKITVEGI